MISICLELKGDEFVGCVNNLDIKLSPPLNVPGIDVSVYTNHPELQRTQYSLEPRFKPRENN